MLNNEDFSNLSREIKSGFSFRRKYLFIGRNFKRSQLPNALCRQNWSAVITTSDNEELNSFFNTSDRTVVCVDRADMVIEPNIENMPIIYLHKIDKSSSWYSDDSFPDTLSEVIRKLSGVTDVLYTVGLYEDEFDVRKLCRRIITYYMGQKKLPEKPILNLKVYEEELANFFDESDEEDYDFVQYETDENVFYKNGRCVSLSDDDLMQVRRFLTLATDGIVDGNHPVGDRQLTLAFENFLKLSPTHGPQWYGYTSETQFNVKRTFEDALVDLVTKALNGEMPNSKAKYDPEIPIVLMGPPASSKSITLGSLAYRIYVQHKNPVFFIKNYEIDFTDEDNFNLLESLMDKIDDLSGDARSLLVWDGSSNKDTLAAARYLANKLHNRGRRFVIVCSSYQYNINYYTTNDKCYDNISKSWTNWNNNIHGINVEQYIHLHNEKNYLIINSGRSVTEGEIEAIKERYKKYADIDIDGRNMRSLLDGGTGGKDIFMYFYHLAYFLRNPLEKGLKDEQINISHRFGKELREIFERRTGSRLGDLCPEFFEKFGITAEDLSSDASSEYPEERFKKFQSCIALFGQFKIKTPRTLAMAVLSENVSDLVYSSENQKIYRFVDEDIPWICCTVTNGEIFFEFRNTEEASLYIQEQFQGTNGCKECMNLILSLFDIYMGYKNSNKTIVRCFSELLKELGPNTEWYSINKFSKDFNEYFQNHMDEIIGKLDEVIKNNIDFMYSLTLNKITLCREYYGGKAILRNLGAQTNIDDCLWIYEEIMDMLAKDISYTDGRIRDIEAQSYVNNYRVQKNQMITELANCNVALFDRQEEYIKFCRENGVEPAEKWKIPGFKTNFVDLFDELVKIINSEPQNGYYYNAVFKIYERHRKDTVKSINYSVLNRIQCIIENSFTVNIINRGANGQDEMGWHISKIKEEMCNANVTLENVLNNSSDISDFMEYHKKMLDNKETSSICFIANSELLRNGIIGPNVASCKRQFTENELNICENIRNYMMSDDIYGIV
ncbi:MAG: hypothetical protein K2J67_08180, partial [Lachnospiraceae bacterium]|nr:hypothetical protein [Lachnospiraceae bacterium]